MAQQSGSFKTPRLRTMIRSYQEVTEWTEIAPYFFFRRSVEVEVNSQFLCEVSDQVIRPESIFNFASDLGHGAQSFFFGAVRGQNHGKKVVAVAYDAAPALARKVLQEIARECAEKWGQDLRIAVFHRTGKLEVGELSVGIGVTSRHRDEAFQACRYIIEEIKIRAPIWKKEFYSNGETDWLKGHALCQHAH